MAVGTSIGPAHRGGATVSSRRLEGLLLLASLAALALEVVRVMNGRWLAFDYRYAYWRAGHQVLLGVSPYVWTHAQILNKIAFVYPALSALMFAPLSLLGRDTGSVLLTLLCVALVPVTLRFLGVRDRRVHAVVLMWMPVYAAWQTSNVTTFMLLGLACVWRWRERALISGLLTGAMFALKPLLWPLLLWMLATRRWRAAASACVSALALNLVAWSVIGVGQFSRYLSAASADVTAAWRTGWGVPALLAHFGFGLTAGLVAMLLLCAALALAVVRAAAIEHDELRALAWTIALALVSSPLLWSHYLELFLVPLAVARPRLHVIWLVGLLLWVSVVGGAELPWQLLTVWAAGIVFVYGSSLKSGICLVPSWLERRCGRGATVVSDRS